MATKKKSCKRHNSKTCDCDNPECTLPRGRCFVCQTPVQAETPNDTELCAAHAAEARKFIKQIFRLYPDGGCTVDLFNEREDGSVEAQSDIESVDFNRRFFAGQITGDDLAAGLSEPAWVKNDEDAKRWLEICFDVAKSRGPAKPHRSPTEDQRQSRVDLATLSFIKALLLDERFASSKMMQNLAVKDLLTAVQGFADVAWFTSLSDADKQEAKEAAENQRLNFEAKRHELVHPYELRLQGIAKYLSTNQLFQAERAAISDLTKDFTSSLKTMVGDHVQEMVISIFDDCENNARRYTFEQQYINKLVALRTQNQDHYNVMRQAIDVALNAKTGEPNIYLDKLPQGLRSQFMVINTMITDIRRRQAALTTERQQRETGLTSLQAALTMRPEVLRFALRMEETLRRHDEKKGATGWAGMSAWSLMSRIAEEYKEFTEAYSSSDRGGKGSMSMKDVANEAIDVANMLMMLLDVTGQLPKDTIEIRV